MKDLTQGSIRRHIVAMATPITIGMLVQTLYYLIDLWFVARLGTDDVAGVSAAGAVVVLVMALTQMLSVGTMAPISRAVGAKDRAGANLVFNQSLLLAAACMLLTLAAGGFGIARFMAGVGASAGIAAAGTRYLLWYLPGLALQFAFASVGAALQGTGITKPAMAVRLVTLAVNIALAPVLIAGWGTGRPLGVAGAGLASTIAGVVGLAMMLAYFVRLESWVRVDAALLRPRWPVQWQMLRIGVPAGGEIVLMFVLNAATFALIRGFGPQAQAGFGIGSRVLQAILMPAMAIAFAVPAIAGQNVGARQPARVRETLRQALLIEFALGAGMVAVCQLWPDVPVRWFTQDAATAQVGVAFLRAISWNFFAAGIVFGCSGMFQALGNTLPALASSATRLLLFVVPATILSQRAGFALATIWHLSVATTVAQAAVSALLVRWQMNRRLGALAAPAAAALPA
jgi:putative MATE family efflux protein